MTTLMPQPVAHRRYGIRQAVHAEFTKLRTLRSTTTTLLATIGGTLLVTVLTTSNVRHSRIIAPQTFDPTNQSLTGLALAQLTIGLLGILMISGEYGSGTIRSSLAAVPRRRLLLGAKVIVIAAVSLVAGELLTFASFFAGRMILSGHAPVASLGIPECCARSSRPEPIWHSWVCSVWVLASSSVTRLARSPCSSGSSSSFPSSFRR